MAALALALGTGACQVEDKNSKEVLKQLKVMDSRLEKIEKGMPRAGAARPGMRQPQRKRPDPGKTYAVPVKGSPSKGKADALVTVVEAYEFACPFCEKSRSIVADAAKDFGDDVRVVYKTFVIHPDLATIPGLAGCAANMQGKFAAMEELIWEKGYKQRKFDAEHMKALAREAGLDLKKFEADMNGPICKQQLNDDRQNMARFGVSGTPSFFVNGRFTQLLRDRDQSVERLKGIISEELRKAQARLAKGGSAVGYYEDWVVAKGLKTL
jgi:protein-disulfide isomerase